MVTCAKILLQNDEPQSYSLECRRRRRCEVCLCLEFTLWRAFYWHQQISKPMISRLLKHSKVLQKKFCMLACKWLSLVDLLWIVKDLHFHWVRCFQTLDADCRIHFHVICIIDCPCSRWAVSEDIDYLLSICPIPVGKICRNDIGAGIARW